MASQTQTAATQSKSPSGLALLFIAVAGVGIVMAIAWAMFSAASAPSVTAPDKTTIQVLQEPGLLDQRQGERSTVTSSAPGNPYVNIHGPARKPSVPSIVTDGLVEHRRGERGMELPNGTFLSPSQVEHRRGELERD
jgi:hypothetical protein